MHDANQSQSLLSSGNAMQSGNCTKFTSDDELAHYLHRYGGLTLTLGLERLVPLTMAYTLIFLTGLLGNAVTCLVIVTKRTMRTSTNLYLLNLSCSDLLTLLLGLPIELWGFHRAYPWRFGESFCILRNAAAETTTTVSILTITAFTVERYVAVSRPIEARASQSLKRAGRVLVCIWLLSIAVSGTLATQFGVVYMQDDAGCTIVQSALCGIRKDHAIKYSFEISTMMFLGPMLLIVLFCVLIAAQLRRARRLERTVTPRKQSLTPPVAHIQTPTSPSTKPIDTLLQKPSTGADARENFLPAANQCKPTTKNEELRVNSSGKQHQSKLSINKMLFAVCAAFFACFAPFHISRALMYFATTHEISGPEFEAVSENIYYVAGTLYYLNATVNPIIYNIMSKKFRRECIRKLCGRCIRQRQRKTLGNHNSRLICRSTKVKSAAEMTIVALSEV